MRFVLMVTLLMSLLGLIRPAAAHFDPGTVVRQFVISEGDGTTEIYVRTPLPLIFADILSGAAPDDAGFLVEGGNPEAPARALSMDAVDANRAAFAARLTTALRWRVGRDTISARVRAYRVHAFAPQLPLTSVASATTALARPPAEGFVPLATGFVDIAITVATPPGAGLLSVQSALPVLELPPDVALDNHIIDFRHDDPRAMTRAGQLGRPLALPVSQLGITMEYVFQGVLHIVEGIDHVFLVVIIGLGAAGLFGLVRNVTAFTLGHGVTLVAGFLGFVPSGAWFIPFVEATIAATILIAAIATLRGLQTSSLMYAVIGLLHGYGFSFVLANVLGADSPELVGALAAFILGIEIGQLIILAAVLICVWAIRQISPQVQMRLQQAALIALAAISLVMLVERIPLIVT